MKINYLKINGYKNLKSKAEFDFAKCQNYSAIIGVNGSGKSNVLEAISMIFGNLYDKKKVSFDWNYEIRYEIGGDEIIIKDGLITNKKVKPKDVKNFLPSQVIASYSGEEQRLWEDIYSPFYMVYFNKVLSRYPDFKPELLYINRFCWNIALIALMCSEKPEVKNFLKDYLGITIDPSIEIKFTYDVRKYPAYANNNDVLQLIQRLNPTSVENPVAISINEIASYDLGPGTNDDYVRKIFYYLYIAFMPQRNNVNKYDKIITGIDVNFNGLGVKNLSEGEKKLLLIKCIMEILTSENSLVLFDEPDAHVHISRKKEVKNFIDKPNHFTIFTTHSPTLLVSLNSDNVKIVSNTEGEIEVVDASTIKPIEIITEGAFTLMDATLAFATTKDILLVEGTNDYKYFGQALERLKRTKAPKYDLLDFTIINCGGAGNVAAVLEQVIIKHLNDKQLCIATFDDDKPGQDGVASVTKVISASGKFNIKAMTHPKIDGWALKEFYTEDYFPITAYKPTFEGKVAAAANFKTLGSIQGPKSIIESTYLNYSDVDYENFSKLLDELLSFKVDFLKTLK